ncbi:MAG: AraC family transcriptional regulator [Cyanobacteria bacterium P01_D01_bin.115]
MQQQNGSLESSYPIDEPKRQCDIGPWQVELLPRTSYEAAYVPNDLVIGFAFERQWGVHAFASDRRCDFRAQPNTLAFVPAGCDVYSCSPHGGEYLTLKTNAETFRDTEFAEFRDIEHRCYQFNNRVDPIAAAAAQTIRKLIMSRQSVDNLLFEQQADTLINQVLQAFQVAFQDQQASSWMTPARLQEIEELIEIKLDQKLTVRDLAAAFHLSSGFFARAFKAAVGQSPHDYILDRRLYRARSLLRCKNLGLSAIALTSGFSSHAHMTSVFRDRLGVTPSEIRREISLSP